MAKKRAAEEEIEIEEEVPRPKGPLATYAEVPKTEMDEWTTALAGFPCDVVSDVFLRWCRESRWTGFIPPPPPPPSAEFMAGRPNVELTAKGLPSFRCARIVDPTCGSDCDKCEDHHPRWNSTWRERDWEETMLKRGVPDRFTKSSGVAITLFSCETTMTVAGGLGFGTPGGFIPPVTLVLV